MEPVVRIIKANPLASKNFNNSDDNYLKVAAYARVSTDSDEQEDSFERQVEYYTNYIKTNPNWRFVKVYSDPGISGTRAEKRPGFQEMIQDCHDGKINRILVKSIARFARNTVDALKYIRELKEIGVSIYFESQNIDTGTPGGDVLITILAATAEEESRTISKNIKWSYQKKFEKGDFQLNYTNFLGYKRDDNRKLVIVPEEAIIVRRIYREYLFGHSISQIVDNLNTDKIPTPSGKNFWRYGVVKSILTNEKYYGTALMGKTFKPDVLSKKRYKNEGQVELYCLDNAFDGIIDKAQFDMVQFEMSKRDKKERSGDKTFGKYSSRYVFSKIIRCGCCGSFYTRCNNMRDGNKKIPSWWCTNHREHKGCQQLGISESSIEKAFVQVLKDLIDNYNDIESVLKTTISSVIVSDPDDKIKVIDERISELQSQMLELHKKKTNGKIDISTYGKEGGKLATMIEDARKERESLESSYKAATIANKRVSEILSVLNEIKPTEVFDDELFRRLIDSITISDRTKLTFKFKVGIERTIIVDIK